MKAVSFNLEFLDPLLSSQKQQTTRGQTDKFSVGDEISIYYRLRMKISKKPIRELTPAGKLYYTEYITEGEPVCPMADTYYAHKLGEVVLTSVYDFKPVNYMCLGVFLRHWANEDDFVSFDAADTWFKKQYGCDWIYKNWTVISWQKWKEVYFYAEGV